MKLTCIPILPHYLLRGILSTSSTESNPGYRVAVWRSTTVRGSFPPPQENDCSGRLTFVKNGLNKPSCPDHFLWHAPESLPKNLPDHSTVSLSLSPSLSPEEGKLKPV
eukprot:Lithocolla_globosa_v1_NODE_5906_length_1167_cov_4.721223.p3 type:complete len:108 gc:universal NODE_5906_length_1167_cov_4.721223:342-19(-)